MANQAMLSIMRTCLIPVILGLATGCGGAGEGGGDGARSAVDSSAVSVGTSAPNPGSVRPIRPGERGHVAAEPIQWNADLVAAHLTGVGLEVAPMAKVSRPMFRVPGRRYQVMGGRAVVEAFFYGDANAVAVDTDKLDTVLVSPRGGTMAWEMAPRLVIDNNMAAVIMTTDARLRAQIETALHSELHGRSSGP